MGTPTLDRLAECAPASSGVDTGACREYLSGLDYGLSYPHLAGLSESDMQASRVGVARPWRSSHAFAAIASASDVDY